jgi:hypothetical protein
VSESENEKMAAALAKYGVNLVDVVRDTHSDTMIRVTHLTEGMIEYAIKISMIKSGQKINERMFKHRGELSTLEKKIDKAKELNLIDEVAFEDAHLLRRIRNRFAHRHEQLHFVQALLNW